MTNDPMPIWMQPERPARGPRPTYSRAQIVAAAIKVADGEGLDAVTMRRVASEVGAGAMSLYRYVPNKDNLTELMVDTVLGEVALPEARTGDFRTDLRCVALRQRATALRHPWLPAVLPRMAPYGPNMLRLIEHTFSILGDLDLDIDAMMEINRIVMSFANGSIAAELAEHEANRRTSMTTAERMRTQAPYVKQLVESGDFPWFTRIVIDSVIPHTSAAEVFERTLGRLLDGLVAGLPQD